MFDKNNSMTQWLIGIFVRFLSSKDSLINCAGVGKRTLLISRSSVPLPFSRSLWYNASIV